MRSPEQDKERIKHILEAIENILIFTKEHTCEEFTSNVMLRHAVFHNKERKAFKKRGLYCGMLSILYLRRNKIYG